MSVIFNKSKLSLFSLALMPYLAFAAPSSEPKYNYGEALQKAWYFYDTQRSGPLPKYDGDLAFVSPRTGTKLHNGYLKNRVTWRGDSGVEDGSDVGLDLTGGWHDAGDHIKFNFPMTYAANFLAWNVSEYRDVYEQTGQLKYAMDNLRWVGDYLLRSTQVPGVIYGQVGNGALDHGFWGPPEVFPNDRPAYKLDARTQGTDLTAQTAAALASISEVFASTEPAYANLLLDRAKELYGYAKQSPIEAKYSDAITDAASFYQSSKGGVDNMPLAAAWLYRTTKDPQYLHDAEQLYQNINWNTSWAAVWDDVSYGLYVLMEQISQMPEYQQDSQLSEQDIQSDSNNYQLHAENHFNYWLNNISRTPGGMAWLDQWASARYNSSTANLMLMHVNYLKQKNENPQLQNKLVQFSTEQLNYILGDNPLNMSYMVGFGDNYSQVAHHRAAHGSASQNIYDPELPKHILYGGLAGGPDSSDGYTTDRNAYVNTEVATDINVGLTGALAGLVKAHGIANNQPLANFPGDEPKLYDEFFVETSSDNNQIFAKVYNETAYPPRSSENLTFRYFADISDLTAQGIKPSDITVATDYGQDGIQMSPLKSWQGSDSIYYTEGSLEGIKLYPGGNDRYRELKFKFRLSGDGGQIYHFSNDPSFQGINSQMSKNPYMTIYDNDAPVAERLVWGVEPTGDSNGNTDPVFDQCYADFRVTSINQGGFQANLDIRNSSKVAISDWQITIDANDIVSITEKHGKAQSSIQGNQAIITNNSDDGLNAGEQLQFIYAANGVPILPSRITMQADGNVVNCSVNGTASSPWPVSLQQVPGSLDDSSVQYQFVANANIVKDGSPINVDYHVSVLDSDSVQLPNHKHVSMASSGDNRLVTIADLDSSTDYTVKVMPYDSQRDPKNLAEFDHLSQHDNFKTKSQVSNNQLYLDDNRTIVIDMPEQLTPLHIAVPRDQLGYELTVSIDQLPNTANAYVGNQAVSVNSKLTSQQLSELAVIYPGSAQTGTLIYSVDDGHGLIESRALTLEIEASQPTDTNSCSVKTTMVNSWSSTGQDDDHYQLQVDVTNDSNNPLQWALSWNQSGVVTQSWNVDGLAPGATGQVTVQGDNPSWNVTLAPGQTINFGYIVNGVPTLPAIQCD